MFSVDSHDLLGSLLDYLADRLPPPIYSLFFALISRSLAYLSSLITCIVALGSFRPFHSNPQDILPPLITLLCAYLALLTAYRTTAWVIRTVIWFFKWGLILGIIFTGVGWYLRDTTGGQGSVAHIQSLLDAINSHVPKTPSGTESASGAPKTRFDPKPPHAWDSFESHTRWREDNQQNANKNEVNPERLMKSIIDITGGLLEQGGQWWKVAKSIMDGAQYDEHLIGQQERQNNRKPRSRSR
ncbi:hypothetical protein AX15_004684 [Amanita polypyramis BW_CC]|nr:hypothetical protein AX15_004684 [Amanita polypyramis BW_CC]